MSGQAGKDLVSLWEDSREWSHKTFGGNDVKGPVGPLKHLIVEAQEAIESPHDIHEYADCLLLIFDASRRAGFDLEELLTGTREKFEIVKKRTYPKTPDGEVSFHVKEKHDEGSYLTCSPETYEDFQKWKEGQV